MQTPTMLIRGCSQLLDYLASMPRANVKHGHFQHVTECPWIVAIVSHDLQTHFQQTAWIALESARHSLGGFQEFGNCFVIGVHGVTRPASRYLSSIFSTSPIRTSFSSEARVIRLKSSLIASAAVASDG